MRGYRCMSLLCWRSRHASTSGPWIPFDFLNLSFPLIAVQFWRHRRRANTCNPCRHFAIRNFKMEEKFRIFCSGGPTRDSKWAQECNTSCCRGRYHFPGRSSAILLARSQSGCWWVCFLKGCECSVDESYSLMAFALLTFVFWSTRGCDRTDQFVYSLLKNYRRNYRDIVKKLDKALVTWDDHNTGSNTGSKASKGSRRGMCSCNKFLGTHHQRMSFHPPCSQLGEKRKGE